MNDYFGNDSCDLKEKRLWLFDMDGTIYQEDTLFEGTHNLLRWIKSVDGEYIFITNNSSKSVVDYVKKVRDMGLEADDSNFFTSSQATIMWLKSNMPGAKVYCQGTKSLIDELKNEKIDVTDRVEKVDVVLVGFDTEMTSDKLRSTCEILSKQNVKYIATNPDLVCPVNFGYIPDCGAICGMIEHATGKSPQFIGKPEATMIDIAMNKSGYSKNETVVVGDRLYTDIQSGINAGVTSVCVLTGETTVTDIENGNIKPTYTYTSVDMIAREISDRNCH